MRLTEAEEAHVAVLAARDRAYSQEIAVFRAGVQDIAATPEGAAALARFNAGDETGALAILADLRRARVAAGTGPPSSFAVTAAVRPLKKGSRQLPFQ